MCDIKIDGLPITLMGHIIPDLLIASLFGIRVLTEAGCEVTFDRFKCIVGYNWNIILEGNKDKSTDLWTLPHSSLSMTTHHSAVTILPASPVFTNAHAYHVTTQIAFFKHTVLLKTQEEKL
jgi:hypothetical protein